MANTTVEKVHGGYKVDGLELLAANCGCRMSLGSCQEHQRQLQEQ